METIEELKKEIELLNGKLQFEENQHKAIVETLLQDCKDSVHDSIMLEVEGIRDLLPRMDERTSEKVARRLSRIEKRLR